MREAIRLHVLVRFYFFHFLIKKKLCALLLSALLILRLGSRSSPA